MNHRGGHNHHFFNDNVENYMKVLYLISEQVDLKFACVVKNELVIIDFRSY